MKMSCISHSAGQILTDASVIRGPATAPALDLPTLAEQS